jgi:enterochelin esterase-like enzyme
MRITRRGLLLGAGGVVGLAAAAGVAVDEGWLPGEHRLHRALGQTGPAGHIPDDVGNIVVGGSFVSRARLGEEVGWSLIYPRARPERLPVMVSLHGHGGDHTTALEELHIDRFLGAGVRAGVPPFAIATVDGGTGYYHPRPSGEDAGKMVLDEFLPLLHDRGLDTGRLAFQGWSMGGYGSLRLAPLLGPTRVPVVAVLSAALWTDPDNASPDGFADAEEYEQYSVMGHQDDLDGIDVRLDCGREDPFYSADRAYVDGFDRPVISTFQDGAHEAAYWTRMLPAQLAFVGHALGRGR